MPISTSRSSEPDATTAAGADASHEDAAMELGASRFQVTRDVVLPDLHPAIVVDDACSRNATRRAGNDT